MIEIQIESNYSEVDRLEKSLENIEKTLNNLDGSETSAELYKVASNFAKISGEINNLKATSENGQAVLDSLRAKMESIGQGVASMKDALSNGQIGDESIIRKFTNGLSYDLDELSSVKESLLSRFKDLNVQLETIDAEWDEKLKAAKGNKKISESLGEDIAVFTAAMASTKDAIRIIEEQISAVDDRIASVSSVNERLKSSVYGIGESVKSIFSEVGNGIVEISSSTISGIGSLVGSIGSSIGSGLANIYHIDELKEAFSNAKETMGEFVSFFGGKFNELKDKTMNSDWFVNLYVEVGSVIENLTAKYGTQIEEVKSRIVGTFQDAKDYLSNFTIGGALSDIFHIEELKSSFADAQQTWGQMMDYFANANIGEVIQSKFQSLAENVSTALDPVTEKLKPVFEPLTTFASEAIEKTKNVVSSGVGAIKNAFSPVGDAFNTAKEGISNAFSGLTSAVGGFVDAAKEKWQQLHPEVEKTKENIEEVTESTVAYKDSLAAAINDNKILSSILNKLPGPIKEAVLQFAAMVKVGKGGGASLKTAFNAAGVAVKGMVKQAWAFVATPLGAAIAAISLAVLALKKYFTDTAEGQQQWNKISAAGGSVLKSLGDIVIALGEVVFKYAKMVGRAVWNLFNLLGNTLLNRNMWSGIGEFVTKLFSGDWTGAVEAWKKGFSTTFDDIKKAVNTFWNDLKDDASDFASTAMKKAGEAVKNMGDVMSKAKDAYDTAGKSNDVRKEKMEETQKTAEADVKIRQGMNELPNLEGQDKLEKIKELRGQINDKYAAQIALAKKEAEIAEKNTNRHASTIEDYEALMKAQFQVLILQRKQAQEQRMLARQEATANKKMSSDAEKAAKAGTKAAQEAEKRQAALAQLAAREAEYAHKQELILQKEIRKQEDLMYALDADKIKLMKKGFEREQAERDLNHKKQLKQIERQAEDAREAVIQAKKAEFDEQQKKAKTEFEAKNKGKKYDVKVFDYNNAEVQDAAQKAYDQVASQLVLLKKIFQMEDEEAIKAFYQSETEKLNALKEKYGTFYEKMDALRFNRDKVLNSESATDADKYVAEVEFKANVKKLEFDQFQLDSGLTRMLGNVNGYSVKSLDEMADALERIIRDNKDFSADGLQKVEQLQKALEKIYSVRAEKSPFSELSKAKKDLKETRAELVQLNKDLEEAGKVNTTVKVQSFSIANNNLSENELKEAKAQAQSYVDGLKDGSIEFFGDTEAEINRVLSNINDIDEALAIKEAIARVAELKKALSELGEGVEDAELQEKFNEASATLVGLQAKNANKSATITTQEYSQETLQSQYDAAVANKDLETIEALKNAVVKVNGEYVTFGSTIDKQKSKEDENAKASDRMKKAVLGVCKAWQKNAKVLGQAIDIVGDVGDAFEAFGNKKASRMLKTVAGIGKVVIDSISNISGLVSSAVSGMTITAQAGAQAMSAVEKASVILAIISAAIQAITKIFTFIKDLHNAKLQDEIDADEKKIKKLQRAYEDLTEAVGKAYSKEAQRLIESENVNLQQQNNLIRQQMELEKQKKESDEDMEKALEDYQDKLRENERKMRENKEAAVDAIFGEDIKSAINNFADAYTNALSDGGNIRKSAKEMVVKMIQGMISESMKADIAKPMELLRQKMEKMYADNIISPQEQAELEMQAAEISDKLREKYQWADGILKNEMQTDTGSTGGFGTMSQESADELNGRFSAMQMILSMMNVSITEIKAAMDFSNGYFIQLLDIQAKSYIEIAQMNETTSQNHVLLRNMSAQLNDMNNTLRKL